MKCDELTVSRSDRENQENVCAGFRVRFNGLPLPK